MNTSSPTELGRAARAALTQRRYPPELLAQLDSLDPTIFQSEPWAALLQGRRLCRLHSRFAEATKLIDIALTQFRARHDSEGELWSLAEWLVMRYHNDEYAIGYALSSRIFDQPMSSYLRAEFFFGQFLCLMGLNRFQSAVLAGESALVDLESESDPWLQRIGRIQVLRNIAAGYHYLGQSRRAVAAAEQANMLAQTHPDTADMRPWCAYELGVAYWRHGRLVAATEALDQARWLAETTQHMELWRWTVATQGHVLRDQDRLDAAIAAYQLANSWGEDQEGPTFIQLRQGRLPEARWSCELMLQKMQQEQDENSVQQRGLEEYVLLLLGLIEIKSNNPEAALTLFERAEAIFIALGARYAQATLQLYRAAAAMILRRPTMIEEGLRSYLSYAASEELLTCSWWMPDLIEPLLIYAVQNQIEAAWAQQLLIERFVNVPHAHIQQLDLENTEHEIARRMQRSLLPEQPPLMPGLEIAAFVEPAAEIGGDFVGYFPHGADPISNVRRQIGVAVGDISGKGLGAALLLSGAVVALSTVASSGAAPSHVVRALHEALAPYTSRSRMTIAFCYALLLQQSHGWAAQIVGAGAVTPLLRRADRSLSWIETAGFPLGSFAHAQWRELRFDFLPGDTLFMFSDGIIEAMNAQREMFGFERLTDLVATLKHDADAYTIVATVIDAVRAHCAPAVAQDDMTLVVLRARPQDY